MSERLVISPEQREPLLEAHEHLALPDAAHAEPLRPGESDPMDVVEARQHVEEAARSNELLNPLERLQAAENESETSSPAFIDRTLRQISLRRELQHVQRALPPAQRLLSKVVHQPVVRVVSETAGASVGRPSGLLGGGLFALLGTSFYLYYAKQIGFTYNYFVFFLLFLVGFALGIAFEFVARMLARSRH
jgi:hypothetical protein